MRGRMFSINPFERKILPHLADKNAEIMTDTASALFSKFLEEDKLDELIQSFSKGELPLNGYAYHPYKVLPPISHILLKNSTQQGQDAVLQLIDLGASPTFIDLVTATELSLPISFVDRLYMTGEVDATRVYYDLGYYNLNKIILDNYLFFTSSFSYTELLLTNSGTISFILETNEYSFDSTIKLERSTR